MAALTRRVPAGAGHAQVLPDWARAARPGVKSTGRGAEIAGNVSVAGGRVRLYGAVGGSVHAAGGRVLIDGPVGGDVNAGAGQVELGPNARIAGALRYRSDEALRRDPTAQVAGGVERLGLMPGGGSREARERAADRERVGIAFAAMGWTWTAGLMVLAAIAALPAFSARVAQTWHEHIWVNLLLRFLLLACLPLALLLLVITLVGIPFALFALLTTLALLPVAYATSAIGLGDWALQRWQAARREHKGWRIGAACASLLALTVLGAMPFVSWLIGLAALLAGLGALMLQARRSTSSVARPA